LPVPVAEHDSNALPTLAVEGIKAMRIGLTKECLAKFAFGDPGHARNLGDEADAVVLVHQNVKSDLRRHNYVIAGQVIVQGSAYRDGTTLYFGKGQPHRCLGAFRLRRRIKPVHRVDQCVRLLVKVEELVRRWPT
jgi:hypothetical protein